MKKCMKLAVTTVVMGCLLSFPAFAAETRAEYKEAVTPIREELKALEEEMDAVRTENKALSARFSAVSYTHLDVYKRQLLTTSPAPK